jgi:hypothetical protein
MTFLLLEDTYDPCMAEVLGPAQPMNVKPRHRQNPIDLGSAAVVKREPRR